MVSMTDTPEAPAERVALHYTGSQSIRLHDIAGANPQTITPNSIVVVNAWAADIILAAALTRGEFKVVTGGTLDDALRTADLPTSGSADEKRTRLADHEAQLAANLTSAAVAENTDTDDQER